MAELPAAGFLPVDKPDGPTSHDVVAAARRALGQRRIGHTGTLDPFASGLLLLAIGRATRLAEYLSDLPKTYHAVMRLGEATDTDDRTGSTIASTGQWRELRTGTIRDALESRVGVSLQVPPMYSARKVGGRRLYEAAREGAQVERSATEVTIHSLSVVGMDGPDITFDVTCSTGTYIRAIARDVGAELGVGGHLVELRRTSIGPHHVTGAVPLADIDDPARARSAWISPARALEHLPVISVDEVQASALAHGRPVPVPAGTAAGVAAAVGQAGLVAVGEVDAGALRPRKVLAG